MRTGATHHPLPITESEGVVTRQHSDAPSRLSAFRHEEDHDSCPFVALRRSSWFLTLLQNHKPTSPLEISQILSSFSIKNDFMFYPPPSTYRFATADDGSVYIRNDILNFTRHTRMGEPHFSVHGIAPLASLSATTSSTSLELMFIPLEFEVQAYHIQQTEVVVERRITVGGPLFFASFRCPIPCNVIRPQKGMSSHIGLFFHCNGEDIGGSGNERLLTVANALHVTLVVPEYPGYGLFAGRCSEASIKGAMERVVQYLFTVDPSLTPSRVILLGHSIGTGVAMHVAAYIQKLFETYQSHYADTFVCPEEISSHQDSLDHATEPFADPTVGVQPLVSTARRCRHNFLGGIVLLSPFATVDCVESMCAFKKYGITAETMQYRQLLMEEDAVVPAPLQWADGCTEEEITGAKQVSVDDWRPPLLFRFARCYSFNRFPTLDVACRLQDDYQLFSQTPMLLVHGVEDPVIGPFHSVAIASKLRESADGRNARVFLSLLRDGGHNDLDCARLIRRFYKDQILLPHMRRQENLRRRHPGASALNASFANAPPRDRSRDVLEDHAPVSPSAVVEEDSRKVAPNMYFLCPGEQITVEMEASKTKNSQLTRASKEDGDEDNGPPLPPHFTNLSFTARDALLRQMSDHVAANVEVSFRTPDDEGGADDRIENNNNNTHCEQAPVENASMILNSSIQILRGHVRPTAAEAPPATATMVHMALQGNADHTDVGSIMVAAMRQFAMPTELAQAAYLRHRHRAVIRRCCLASWFIALGLFVLGVGIAHAVLASESQARKLVPTLNPSDFHRDNRVLAWYVIETTFNALIVFLCLSHYRYGLGRLSKYPGNSRVVSWLYGAVTILAWALVIGTGIVMGLVLSLAQPHHGGVAWSKWAPYPTAQRTWVSRVPRWVMLAFSIWHFLLMMFLFIKNH